FIAHSHLFSLKLKHHHVVFSVICNHLLLSTSSFSKHNNCIFFNLYSSQNGLVPRFWHVPEQVISVLRFHQAARNSQRNCQGATSKWRLDGWCVRRDVPEYRLGSVSRHGEAIWKYFPAKQSFGC